MNCPLCLTAFPAKILLLKAKLYHHCTQCDLRFLDRECYLSEQHELQHYRQHNNDVSDHRYQKYVEPLVKAVSAHLAPGSQGLDFGCGEGPVTTYLLEKLGYKLSLYDPYFAPDTAALDREYDFIIVSEAAEHFHEPHREFERLGRLLRPGGLLCIMTKFYSDEINFETWSYRIDPTHVCFYSEKTFYWMAERYGFHPPKLSLDRVAIFKKRTSHQTRQTLHILP